jgi:hypothetical protein
VLGVLAGSLADLFKLGGAESQAAAPDAPLYEELAALRTELQALEGRLGEAAERARSEAG